MVLRKDQTPHPQEWFHPNDPHPASPPSPAPAGEGLDPLPHNNVITYDPHPPSAPSPVPTGEGLIRCGEGVSAPHVTAREDSRYGSTQDAPSGNLQIVLFSTRFGNRRIHGTSEKPALHRPRRPFVLPQRFSRIGRSLSSLLLSTLTPNWHRCWPTPASWRSLSFPGSTI